MVWSRVDSIKHKDIVKFKYLYDYYSGFVVLPSKNIIGFILSSIYSSELPYNEWLNEIRVVKFDKNGKAVLKDCSITSIIDFPTDLQVLIAPNPFSTETNITISNDSYRDEYLISVCDITGRLIDEYHFTGNSFTLKRAYLLAGVYLCTIKNIQNNKMITKKIVIE